MPFAFAVEFPLESVPFVESVEFVVEVEFRFGNGSGSWKISSSNSVNSSSLGFSNGSREPVVTLILGLVCNRSFMGAISKFACITFLPLLGKSIDILGYLETYFLSS